MSEKVPVQRPISQARHAPEGSSVKSEFPPRPRMLQNDNVGLTRTRSVGTATRNRRTHAFEHVDIPDASIAPRLTGAEIRRRLCHILPGLLPLILWHFPHKDPLGAILRNIIFGLIGGIGISIYLAQKYLTRDGEKTWSHAVLGYTMTVLGTIVLLPAHIEIGFAVLAILAFGDGMATLGGKLLQGPRIAWNPSKTWAGFTCFIIGGGCMSTLIYWGEATPRVSWQTALLCGMSGTIVAALVETLPMRLNDNIRVGIVSAATLVIAHAIFVGL